MSVWIDPEKRNGLVCSFKFENNKTVWNSSDPLIKETMYISSKVHLAQKWAQIASVMEKGVFNHMSFRMHYLSWQIGNVSFMVSKLWKLPNINSHYVNQNFDISSISFSIYSLFIHYLVSCKQK